MPKAKAPIEFTEHMTRHNVFMPQVLLDGLKLAAQQSKPPSTASEQMRVAVRSHLKRRGLPVD